MSDTLPAVTPELLDEIEVKANAAEKVTPGHWETDTEPQDDAPHRHDEYAIFDGKGRRFIGTENSDASWGLLETDTCDEYGCAVWNEPARVTTDHIARMNPPTTLALVARIRELEAENAKLKREHGEAMRNAATAIEAEITDEDLASLRAKEKADRYFREAEAKSGGNR